VGLCKYLWHVTSRTGQMHGVVDETPSHNFIAHTVRHLTSVHVARARAHTLTHTHTLASLRNLVDQSLASDRKPAPPTPHHDRTHNHARSLAALLQWQRSSRLTPQTWSS
jgi:hypothetical protein